MSYLEVKYCGLISSRLELFKLKKHMPYQATFRCTFCGDSKKNRLKTRGFLYEKKGKFTYHCFNCNIHYSFYTFLQMFDEVLHHEYVFELYKDSNEKKRSDYIREHYVELVKPSYIVQTALIKLKKISQLKAEHPAKLYIVARQIPNPYHTKLFYAPKFFHWAAEMTAQPYSSEYDEPRLVIPFINKDNNLFGFQGRSFDPKAKMRYYTYLLDDTFPKVFNLDTVDFSRRTYVTEGAIDAMFLQNSLAMTGADLTNRNISIVPENTIMVFDNEPRNAQIVERMERAIERDYSVFFWPKMLINYKDINELVLGNYARPQIQEIIDNNSLRGFEAKVRLLEWKRV